MIEVFITKDVLPDGLKLSDIGSSYLTYSFNNINNPFFVKKGDTIVQLTYVFDEGRETKSTSKIITSPCDGIIDRSHLFSFSGGIRKSADLEAGGLFYRILSEKEYIDSINSSFTIIEDEVTGGKRIHWDYVNGNQKGYYLEDYKSNISFNIFSGWPTLFIRFYKSFCKPRKKDTVYILFDDKTVLSYSINEVVKSSGDWTEVSFKLSQEDLDILSSRNFVKIRLDSPKEIEGKEFNNRVSRLTDNIGYELFKKYVNTFILALGECGFKWPERVQNLSQGKDNLVGSDPCYVYLMVDTANGFHKIGISNHPEYREGTLQSEKPTIELVCAKQYPSRVIASAIESALHTAFGEKRLRGEWFNLSEKEVNDIKLTLQ